MRKYFSREALTTGIEIVGATMIAVGVGLVVSLGAALIAGGVLILIGSYFAAIGGTE